MTLPARTSGSGRLGGRSTALPAATALAQARAAGVFTTEHDAFWTAARRAHGDAGGTRALIEVLLHRHMAHIHVLAGITAALRLGSANPDVVAVQARSAAENHPPANADEHAWPAAAAQPPRVVSLPRRRAGQPPPADSRPLPSVDAYDELLAGGGSAS